MSPESTRTPPERSNARLSEDAEGRIAPRVQSESCLPIRTEKTARVNFQLFFGSRHVGEELCVLAGQECPGRAPWIAYGREQSCPHPRPSSRETDA